MPIKISDDGKSVEETFVKSMTKIEIEKKIIYFQNQIANLNAQIKGLQDKLALFTIV
jgi:hypothetical protein